MIIPLIFVRYAPGSCGTFLITLLSSSPTTACWATEIEAKKGCKEFPDLFFAWFKKKYTTDLTQHLKHEPHHPYMLDFWSSKYPRGDDTTVEGFIDLITQRNDAFLLQNIQQNKHTLLRLNKSVVPKFGQGNAVINIIVDSDSRKWLHRTRLIKLFGHENGYFVLKEQHPQYLKAKNYRCQFNNPFQIQSTMHGFVKNYVINDRMVHLMSQPWSITQDSSNLTCPQFWINLSQLLTPDTAQIAIQDLASALKIELNQDLIQRCCTHYYNTNVLPLMKSRT